MAQQTKLGKGNTTVRYEDGDTIVRFHLTDILRFDDARIVLNTGGWYTATTKTRLNQAANQFGLGYHVRQVKGLWYVVTPQGSRLTWGYRDDVINFGR